MESTPGNSDTFVARYDSSGTLQWAKRAWCADGDFGVHIDVIADGSSFITGSFGAGLAPTR